jgi:hypothetical protein
MKFDLLLLWLPMRDYQQNFLVYHLGFSMSRIKKTILGLDI